MDEPVWSPKVLANKVIFQFVQHLLSEDMIVEPDDYASIRLVFRKSGGSWEALARGDVVMNELLSKIISAWGQMPERKRDSDTLI